MTIPDDRDEFSSPPSTPTTGDTAGYPGVDTAAGAPEDTAVTTTSRTAPGFNERGHVRRTRVSGVWIGLIGTAVFLILLVVFIAQNSRQVSLHFFGWHGQFSLALTIVLSAVIGVLIVAIPGSVRIVQLRRALRKNVPGGKIS